MSNLLGAKITALNSARNIIDQQAQKLEGKHRKLHKYSMELKNIIKNQSKLITSLASIFGMINLIEVLFVGCLNIQKQQAQPQIN